MKGRYMSHQGQDTRCPSCKFADRVRSCRADDPHLVCVECGSCDRCLPDPKASDELEPKAYTAAEARTWAKNIDGLAHSLRDLASIGPPHQNRSQQALHMRNAQRYDREALTLRSYATLRERQAEARERDRMMDAVGKVER